MYSNRYSALYPSLSPYHEPIATNNSQMCYLKQLIVLTLPWSLRNIFALGARSWDESAPFFSMYVGIPLSTLMSS